MRKIYFSVLMLFSSLALSAEWLRVEYDSQGMFLKDANTVALEKKTSEEDLIELSAIPFIHLTWSNKTGQVIHEKNRPDPRALWAPMGDNGQHDGVFIKRRGEFVLRIPKGATSVELEYFDPQITTKKKQHLFIQ